MVDKLEAGERARRDAMRHHEQMLDAEKLCVPCKLCGGAAKISDAGTGAGYYISCSNSTTWRDSTGCLINERRLGGWAYNVMDWWNRLHAATSANGEQVERDDIVTRTPTEDARERVKVLEEALRPFAAVAEHMSGRNGIAIGYDHTNVTYEHFRRARTALGNKETDRHG